MVLPGRPARRDLGDPRPRTGFMAFVSAVAFVVCISVMVLLAEPPGVIVAIIVVVVAGVLLSTFVPSSLWGRARWRRRQGSHRRSSPPAGTTDPIADLES
jgi:Flp pilus assembly protein TadB